MSDLQLVAAELSRAVNRASAENGSNTPDYVLGEFLAGVLEAFHAAVRARDEHSSYKLVCGTMRSADRLAEVDQLAKELTDERAQHQQTTYERARYKRLYETLRAELQAATARADTARAEGQASAYQDAADRVARMRWESPGVFWNTYLSISDTLRDLAEQARKVTSAPNTFTKDGDDDE